MTPAIDPSPDPFAPVGGFGLAAYVAVCRALVRTAGGSARHVEEVLAVHGLSARGWERVSATWAERIRRHPAVHAEFGRLYARSLETSDAAPAATDEGGRIE